MHEGSSFVEVRLSLERVVELAQEAVEQISLGRRVPVSCATSAAVVLICSFRSLQGCERPEKFCCHEPVVFDEPPAHVSLLPGGSGDRRRPGVGLQRPCIGEAGTVIADLGQDPCTELDAEAGEAQEDLRVWVLEERCLHCDGELVGSPACRVELEQQGGELEAHRVLDGFRVPDIVAAEDLLQPRRLDWDASDPARTAEGGPELSDGQFCRPARCRGQGQDEARVGPDEAVLLAEEGIQCRRVIVPQERTDLVGQLLPRPDGVLLGAGEDGYRADQVSVLGQGPVGGHIGAQDVRQHQGITVVGLLPRDCVPVPVSGRGERVHGVDLPKPRAQGRDQESVTGLDRHRDRILCCVAVLGEQLQKETVAGGIVGGAPLGQQRACLVDEGDVMVMLAQSSPQ